LKPVARPYFIVSLFALWVTRQFWLPGHFVVGFDTSTYAGPNWSVGKSAFLDFRIPLINQFSFGGAPHLGNPQSGVLSPLRWASYLFDVTRGLNLLAASHVLILALGVVFLARRLGASLTGATASGIVILLCGATSTKSIQLEQIMVVAWLPWILAAIHVVLKKPKGRNIALLSAMLTMCIVSGHPQMTYQVAFVAGIFALGLVAQSRAWRDLRYLAAAVFLSTMTCAIQLVSALAATSDSFFKGGRDISDLGSRSLVMQVHTSAQALFGTVYQGRPDYFAGSFESIGYLGILTFVLFVVGASASVLSPTQRKWSAPLIGIVFLSLVWSLGPRTPIFRAAFEFLPGFNQARVSSRWLIIVAIIIAVFVGFGLDAVRAKISRRHLAILIGILVLVTTAIAVGPVASGSFKNSLTWILTAALAVTLISMSTFENRSRVSPHRVNRSLVALLIFELILLNRSSIVNNVGTETAIENMGGPTTQWLSAHPHSTIAITLDGGDTKYLVSGLRPNAQVHFDISSIDGYDGGVQISSRWALTMNRFSEAPTYDLPLRNSIMFPLPADQLARLGVRYALVDNTYDISVVAPDWLGPKISDELFSVWENPLWIGNASAWFATRNVEGIPADELRNGLAELGTIALVEDSNVDLSCTINCDALPVTFSRLTPEHLFGEVDLDQPALVSLHQQALPGWEVQVDGKVADVVEVDGIFLGVVVPSGHHEIEWRYRPTWLTWSKLVSVFGLLLTLGLAVLRSPVLKRYAHYDNDSSAAGPTAPIASK
jgi:hypothetical protein